MQESNPTTAEEYLALGAQATGRTVEPSIDSMRTQLNDIVKLVTVDADGKFQYPAETPPHLRLAVEAEKKFRDTQSSYSKGQAELKEAKDELQALKATQAPKAQELDEETLETLEELKHSDPDAYFNERTKAESAQRDASQELDRRRAVLAELNASRITPITPDMLDEDVPARINNKLLKGQVTFDEYLTEVASFLGDAKPTVIANPVVDSATSMLGAGSVVVDNTIPQIDYSKITF